MGLRLRSFGGLRAPQDDNFSSGWTILTIASSAAGAGCSSFGGVDHAYDRAFAGGARLAVVADEKMFDDFVYAGVLEAVSSASS